MTHKILIVDDEPDLELLMRQRFRRLIRSGEYELFFAHNGIEALQTLQKENDIGVMLTDINMPQMDGLALLDELKRLNQQPGHLVKAIVVSAYGDMDNIRTAMNRGAFDFLVKPIDFGDVESTIVKTLDYVEQLHENRRVEEYRIAKEVAEENFAKLQQLEIARDSLVHMIVHDLRTPLTSILTGIQMVDSFGELSEPQREIIDIAAAGGQTLLDMINDLLNISKMENGALKLNSVEVRSHFIGQQALNQVRHLAQHKTIDLQQDLAEDLPAFSADDELLCRVLVNLISNSIKFTPRGGMVHLSTSHNAQDNIIFFEIRDNGQGIPAESIESIFDKFGQVEGTSGTRTSTGLGLTFCKLAIEAHGGSIWVESTVGTGSKFSFSLPLNQAEKHEMERAAMLEA